ncbi:MAG: hypothetical protein GDA53_09550, partial [Rhodobacteraceae bacterium]|nr:hypothetical protein [Paracoccaceae bacterium]
MWFDVQAALLEIEATSPATTATTATSGGSVAEVADVAGGQDQKSGPFVAEVASVAAPPTEISEAEARPVPKAHTPATTATIATNTPSRNTEAETVADLMDRFHERAAMLEFDECQPRDRAVWLAALAVFVLPDEREDYFGPKDRLKLRYRQVSLAVGDGLVVTFHE